MRVQFTNEENKIIEERRATNALPEKETYIDPKYKDKIITLGLEIKDPYKFNMFIQKFLTVPEIADQIGAKCVHVDLSKPITKSNLIFIRNYIDELLFNNFNDEEKTNNN